jgi:GNAT superfamily N-acetyltransferase
VHPAHHRQGIGRQLLQTVERTLISLSVKKVSVETVGWSHPEYPPYEKTRAFYRGMGYGVSKKLETGEEVGYTWQMYEYSKALV